MSPRMVARRQNNRRLENDYWNRRLNNIRNSAARLFWRKGYLGTSMDDIARATNLNKASIYYYFPSKAHILYAVATTPGMEILAKAQRLLGDDLLPEDKLRLLVMNHLKWLTSHPGIVSIERTESQYLPPKLLKSYIGVKDQYEAIFHDVIAEGIARGRFRPISAKMASLFTLGLLNSIFRWFRLRGEFSPSEISNLAFEYIHNGLRNH